MYFETLPPPFFLVLSTLSQHHPQPAQTFSYTSKILWEIWNTTLEGWEYCIISCNIQDLPQLSLWIAK